MNHAIFLFGLGVLVAGLFVSIEMIIAGSVLIVVDVALAACSYFLTKEVRQRYSGRERIEVTEPTIASS